MTFDEALHEFAERSRTFGAAKAARVKLEEVAKSIKAEAYLKARALGDTVTDADAKSRRDPDYLEAVDALATQVELEETSRLQAKALEIWMDWQRTLESSRREEMRLAR